MDGFVELRDVDYVKVQYPSRHLLEELPHQVTEAAFHDEATHRE